MRTYTIVLGCFWLLINPAWAEFVGEVKLIPEGCQTQAICTLAEDFGYVDQDQVGWQADKGEETDGASIPKWAQRFVGIPFTPDYLNAAVLHDHYSKSVRPVRGWFETQAMFHEVLLESGVSKTRAAVLYAGVLIGSGKWIVRMKGQPCNIGDVCINSIVDMTLERESESYGQADYEYSFNRMRQIIEAGGGLTTEQVQALALQERPDSIFLLNPSGVIRQGLEDWSLPIK